MAAQPGRGWMTAEYSLLPASTGDRVEREASRGKQQGRTVEIQRLIGRAVRAVVDFSALGERTIWLDCDVLQADGGTRCAAICGAYVAARRALDRFGLSKRVRRLGRRRLGRRRRRRAAARPRLLGGLERRHGHERRHDRRRPADRGAGDRRARPVHARDARRVARPRGGRDRRRSPTMQAEAVPTSRFLELAATRIREPMLCSRNAHKARELEVLLPGWTIEPLDAEDSPETGETYYGERAAQGGVRADARARLDDRRGLRHRGGGARRPAGAASARYAPEGAPAIAKLLDELDGVDDRRARYVSELVAISPGGEEFRGTGILEGRIASEPRGSEGFGYDPDLRPGRRGAHGRRARRRLEIAQLASRALGAGVTRGARAWLAPCAASAAAPTATS